MTSAGSTLPEIPDVARKSDRGVLLLAWLLALALIALQVHPIAVATIRQGILFDGDDIMRLVQLREWMSGQGWTDVTQYRLNPPQNPVSHWSRFIELPIAGLILLLRVVVDPTTAERIATVLWPSLLLAGFVASLLAIAERLVRPVALVAGAAILALNPALLFQFVPGRIDHHGVQMLLMLTSAALTARAIFSGSRGAAIAAGVCCSLSLAIGLATVPLVGVISAAFAIAWIAGGEARRGPVATYGASLAIATLSVFLASVPPQRWFLATADSLSLPWLWLAIGGGGLLVALALFASPGTPLRRSIYAGAVGTFIGAIFATLWPAALTGPYADMDPLVRAFWLAGVGEAQPLPLLVQRDPPQFLYLLALPLIGWLGLALAAIREGRKEPRFVLLFAMATVALAITLDQMRGAPLAAMFGFFGWLYLIDRAAAAGQRSVRAALASTAAAALLFMAALPFGWHGLAAAISPQAPSERASCKNPSDMAEFANVPPGLVLAPPRLGPMILATTGHDVLAAPYHRNNAGNRTAILALGGTPEAALQIIEERGVRYVAMCLGDPDLDRLGSRTEDALIERLRADRPPEWLSPIQETGPIRTWRVEIGRADIGRADTGPSS